MAGGIATLTALKKQNPYDKFNEVAQIIEVFLLESAKKYGVALLISINNIQSLIIWRQN
jgi:glutamate-1-semialdehyde 2,1-aminomutase